MKPSLDTSLAYKYFMSYRLFDGQRFDEIIVPYAPEKSLQKRVQPWLKKHGKQTYMGLMLLSLLIAIVFHTWLPILALVLAAGCLPAGLYIFACMSPTHIALSPNGVRLYHIHWFGDKSTKLVSWKTIGIATITRGKSMAIREDWLDFRNTEGASVYRIRLDGIANGEHRRRLLAAVKQFIPIERVDVHLQDSLNPVRLTTTQMWLDVLGSAPKRLHDSMLHKRTLVANGRYRIIQQLGVGGQGTAYLAEQLVRLDEHEAPAARKKPLSTVVLKEFVLPAEASLKVNKKALETIERVAELLRKLSHPQVVSVLDLFVDDHRAYLVLEHVPGQSLREYVQENGPMPESTVIRLAVQMCDVLEHLHGQDPPVIHRDFTPDNLILRPDGMLKLIDFDVAQQLESTATRTVVGKHAFIAPEQFRGRAQTQSDIYSLGATLYYLLTAQEPEPITQANVAALRTHVKPTLNELISKCTEQEVERRIENAAQVRQSLKEIKT